MLLPLLWPEHSVEAVEDAEQDFKRYGEERVIDEVLPQQGDLLECLDRVRERKVADVDEEYAEQGEGQHLGEVAGEVLVIVGSDTHRADDRYRNKHDGLDGAVLRQEGKQHRKDGEPERDKNREQHDELYHEKYRGEEFLQERVGRGVVLLEVEVKDVLPGKEAVELEDEDGIHSHARDKDGKRPQNPVGFRPAEFQREHGPLFTRRYINVEENHSKDS
jgi:hypothetical protein